MAVRPDEGALAQLARKVSQQAAVAELGRLALTGTDVAAVRDEAVRLAAEGLGTERAAILLLDEDARALTCRSNVGWERDEIRPVPLTAESQLGMTFLMGEPIVLDDLRSDERFAASRHLLELGLTSAASVVIRGEDGSSGVLVSHASTPRTFTDDDVLFLRGLANVVAAALDNARAREAERRARERAEALQRVTAALAGAPTPEIVFEIVLSEGIACCGARAGLVALVDDGGKTLTIREDRGYESALDGWRTFPVDARLPASEAVRTRAPVFCATIDERDERFPAMAEIREPNHALGCLPLVARDRVLGAFVLSFAGPRSFDADDEEFLQALASQCAQAIERTRLGLALERERELLAAVLQQMPSGVIIAEAPSGRLLLGNDQVEQIWRKPFLASATVGDYAGYVGYRIDGRPYTPEEWPLARSVTHGDVVVNEPIVLERGDGTRGIASVSSAPLRDDAGRIVAGVVVFHDMTEEFEARQEAERRADAARALAFVADGVCFVDTEGVVRLWNDAAARATGRAAAVVVGRALRDALPGWESIADDVPTAAAGSGQEPRPVALPLELGGEERWLAIAGVSFDEGTVFAFRDVTEERKLETMKSDFIATVSHELRTPLAAVYGAATTLRQRPTLDFEEREQFLLMIEEQAERLSRIVNEILIASRLDSGELGVRLETVDARTIAEQVLEVAERGSGGFTFALHAPDDLPPVVADADRLRQVLGNLLENAMKYANGSERAELHVERGDDSVRFVVRDFGLGIPPADHERIFEKFYRVDASMTGGVSGTGLGLYIVRELVRRMDGRVGVESRVGEGSRFVVELPVAT